jgi:kinesin family protein 2/24
MTSVYDHAATALFEELGEDPADVTLLFLELTNTRCSDLFGEGKSIKLVDGTAVGATEVSVASAEEMMEFIQFGNRVRRTEETGVHAASSRSHSVLQIHIRRGRGIETEGCLVLVDLAGSEQAIDSAYHNAQRQKEGAAINSSLSALKGCIRARAAGSEANHHYRKSVLTMALKASFTSPEAATVIIATASPASKVRVHVQPPFLPDSIQRA